MSELPNPELSGEGASFRQSSNHILQFSLRPGWRATLFLLLSVGGGLWLTLEACRVAWLTYELDSHSVSNIEQALRQDPSNPDLFHRLGIVYSYEPNDVNLSEAEKNLRKAVELNPRRWDFWLDLGTDCDFVGDTACSDEAFARALAFNPMTPALLWAMGNHYLLTGRQEKAFPYFRRLLDLDPNYLDVTFRLCVRATRDPEAVYREVVPRGQDDSARFAFLMYLSSIADYESAMRIWGQMILGSDRAPSLSKVKPFLDFLIDHNQIQDAGTVWNDLQRARVISPGLTAQAGNLLYDGNFEGPQINTGFDWRLSDSPNLTFDFSDPSGYKSPKCLRIDFAVGQNADYDLLNQVVLVKPNTRYQLTAYVRSDNLTSESGPRLRVLEMGCTGCDAQTSDETVGTTSWHATEVSFMTQPQTQAVRVSFWRPRDQTYSHDITGTVWLDDVKLSAVDVPGPHVNPGGSR